MFSLYVTAAQPAVFCLGFNRFSFSLIKIRLVGLLPRSGLWNRRQTEIKNGSRSCGTPILAFRLPSGWPSLGSHPLRLSGGGTSATMSARQAQSCFAQPSFGLLFADVSPVSSCRSSLHGLLPRPPADPETSCAGQYGSPRPSSGLTVLPAHIMSRGGRPRAVRYADLPPGGG